MPDVSSLTATSITGLVALLLQQKGTLTPTQVKNKLKAACAVPGQPTGSFDPKWGFGLIDASKL